MATTAKSTKLALDQALLALEQANAANAVLRNQLVGAKSTSDAMHEANMLLAAELVKSRDENAVLTAKYVTTRKWSEHFKAQAKMYKAKAKRIELNSTVGPAQPSARRQAMDAARAAAIAGNAPVVI